MKIYQNESKEDLVTRLRKRAEIRRSIPRGEPDRISDLLEEAADEIMYQNEMLNQFEETFSGEYGDCVYEILSIRRGNNGGNE